MKTRSNWCRPWLLAALFALLTVVGIGCGGSDGTTTAPAAAPAATDATAPAGGDAVKDLTIGYAGPTLNNAFFVGLSKGVRDGTSRKGWKLNETNANGDASTQSNDANNLVTQGVDALILTPIDADGIVPAVEAANAAKIPVFTLDRGARGGDITSFVETDNKQAGRDAATYIVEQLTKRYGAPQGNVVDLQGLVGTTAAADREEGFQEVMKANPTIKIVANQPADFDQEKALNVTTNILQANPKIDAIFGANDDNTVGATRAIDSANRFKPPEDPGHIIVVGIDGTAQALDAIRSGKQSATISQNPIKMAAKAIDFIEQIKRGEPVEQRFFYPTLLITKENIDSPEVTAYGLWSAEAEAKG